MKETAFVKLSSLDNIDDVDDENDGKDGDDDDSNALFLIRTGRPRKHQHVKVWFCQKRCLSKHSAAADDDGSSDGSTAAATAAVTAAVSATVNDANDDNDDNALFILTMIKKKKKNPDGKKIANISIICQF